MFLACFVVQVVATKRSSEKKPSQKFQIVLKTVLENLLKLQLYACKLLKTNSVIDFYRENPCESNSHTNCFENIFWELKIGILPEFTDKKLKDYAANLFRGEINT